MSYRPARAVPSPRPPRTLIVEDDPVIALMIESTLAELGYPVAGITHAPDAAIATIERQQVEFAILDINLGRKRTSFGVADALIARGIPFIFATGHGQTAMQERYRDTPVLPKPFTVSELSAFILQHAKKTAP